MDTEGKYGGKLIGLTLKFQSYDNIGKVIRGKLFKPFVVLVYHPYNRRHLDEENWEFKSILDTLLSRAQNNTEIIMRADVNCSIGSR